jgi:hypothetical protein
VAELLSSAYRKAEEMITVFLVNNKYSETYSSPNYITKLEVTETVLSTVRMEMLMQFHYFNIRTLALRLQN